MLEDILQSIQKKADDKASEIIAQAKTEAGKISKRYEDKMGVDREALLEKAEQKAENKVSQTKFRIHSRIQTEILKKKKEIIDALYLEVKETLAGDNEKEQKAFWKLVLENVPNDEKGELKISERDYSLIAKLAKEKGIKVAKDKLDATGGFQFESKTIDLDYRIETILKSIEKETNIEVAKILFG